MAEQKDSKSGDERADRLKAALKANMARRKAQARARTSAGDDAAPARSADKQSADKQSANKQSKE